MHSSIPKKIWWTLQAEKFWLSRDRPYVRPYAWILSLGTSFPVAFWYSVCILILESVHGSFTLSSEFSSVLTKSRTSNTDFSHVENNLDTSFRLKQGYCIKRQEICWMEPGRDSPPRKPRKWWGENNFFVNISRSISWKAARLYKIICVTREILGLLKLWSSKDAKKHSNVQANSEEQSAIDSR